MISNGQYANSTNFNNAFLSRTGDTSTAGRVGLSNTLAESGTAVTNPQRDLNALWSFVGGLINQAKTYKPTWAASIFGTTADSVVEKLVAILAAFDPATGALATRAGAEAITLNAQTHTVTFSGVMSDALYIVTASVTNVIDATPIFLQCIVTAKTVGGFTVLFNAPVDTANYVLEYQVNKAA